MTTELRGLSLRYFDETITGQTADRIRGFPPDVLPKIVFLNWIVELFAPPCERPVLAAAPPDNRARWCQ